MSSSTSTTTAASTIALTASGVDEKSAQQLKALEGQLLECPFALTADPTRVLLKKGRLLKLNNGLYQTRHFILTNDMLLWSKIERGDKFRYRGHVNLSAALLTQHAAPSGRSTMRPAMAPDFCFTVWRMDFNPKAYTLRAETFGEWFEWTTLLEERVDSFATQQREDHERLIAELLRDESRSHTSPPTAAGSATSMFVALCDSLVQSEKSYADALDCILKEYWIPLCQSSIVDPRNEVTMLFGNVEKIAMAHVEVLSTLEEQKIDEDVKKKYGSLVAEALVVLKFLRKPDVIELCGIL